MMKKILITILLLTIFLSSCQTSTINLFCMDEGYNFGYKINDKKTPTAYPEYILCSNLNHSNYRLYEYLQIENYVR